MEGEAPHLSLTIGLVVAHALSRDTLASALAIRTHQVLVVDTRPIIDNDVSTIHSRTARCGIVVIGAAGLPHNARRVIRHLVTIDPLRGIVVLAATSSPLEFDVAVAAGATSVVGIDAGLSDILDVIEASGRGDSHVSDAPRDPTVVQTPRHCRAPLSARETEVLQMVVDGLDAHSIARQLYISIKTVKHHLSSIYSKLGTTNRTNAVVSALRSGLVDLYRN